MKETRQLKGFLYRPIIFDIINESQEVEKWILYYTRMYGAMSLLVANGNSGAMVLLPRRDLVIKGIGIKS